MLVCEPGQWMRHSFLTNPPGDLGSFRLNIPGRSLSLLYHNDVLVESIFRDDVEFGQEVTLNRHHLSWTEAENAAPSRYELWTYCESSKDHPLVRAGNIEWGTGVKHQRSVEVQRGPRLSYADRLLQHFIRD